MCAKVSRKADAVLRRKAAATVRKPNPFETVVMKTKHAVLNRGTQSKRPGQLHRLSHEKREQTLGKEFALLHKTNQFMDARQNGRYARQPSRKEQAKEMYNLNLTHGGRTMHEIEHLDDVPDGADEDEDEDGMLQDAFTSATHFGGGSDDDSGRPAGKDRKTVIEEMIAESKRQKTERQRENDEMYEMRLRLDDELKSLMPQFTEHIRRDSERPKPDDYDRALREMVFEPRGAPTEKLKSIDRAAEEQKRREVAEREKQQRMQQQEAQRVTQGASRPISADALGDDYLVEGEGQEEAYYGEPDGDDVRNGSAPDEEEEEEEDEEEDDEGEESDSSEADSLSDLKAAVQQEDDSEDEQDAEPEPEPAKQTVAPKAKAKPAAVAPTYTLRMVDVPREYEQFAELLDGHEGDVQGRVGVVASMVHTLRQKPFLHKSRWSVLFAYALNYLGVRFAHATSATIAGEFEMLHLLTPLLHDIAQTDPSGIGRVFHSVLEEKYSVFRKQPRRYPDLATVVLLKLVPVLFSASDRRHSIVTPALVFVGEILSRCQVRNRRDIARGLLLVTTVLECAEHSKRFLPSTVAFLTGVLGQACAKDALHPLATVGQPFKLTSLQLSEADVLTEADAATTQLTGQDLLLGQLTPSFKVRAIVCTVTLLSALCTQLDSNPALPIVAAHFLIPLHAIRQAPSSQPVQTALDETIAQLSALAGRTLPYLAQAKQKPKPLRLLEPKINPVYEDIRRRPKTAVPVREQRRKLQQKIKKVTRGAKREIRLDNEYLAKLQHKRRMESDRERQQKVRQIFSHASHQQAELKSLDRRAKYRK
ncbi:AGAP000397-PA [Anopheles gambiae str. PEST]|uniref:AGAP000397-PA n=1 Tax=Anopheles gambiae TaxID=7165 RepID=Q7QFB7_ANOGA|nr:AGAP000397-PA [Anopheles gambiae str. PEST]